MDIGPSLANELVLQRYFQKIDSKNEFISAKQILKALLKRRKYKLIFAKIKEADMKIMVCYDETKEAMAALQKAREYAKARNASLLLVVKSISRELPLKRSLIEETENKLDDEIKNLVKGDNIPYETLLLVGSPDVGEQLVKVAEKENIDQLVIGIVKKSKVGKLLFGSTAQYVILNAPCPVLTVRT